MYKKNKSQRSAKTDQTVLNLSHSIKNILQAVRSSTELLDKSLKAGNITTARRGLKILSGNLERIEELVLDVLARDKAAGPKFKKCDFNATIRSVAQTLRPAAKEQQKKIQLKTDKKITSVSCDEGMIYDAVLNLAVNALGAVAEGKGFIKIITVSDSQNKQVVVKVIDNGFGIEDTTLIFEPFHTTKQKDGTGLGLAIVGDIAAMHHGKIEAVSVPSKGSEFTLTLPVKQKK
jgi:two-component system, NtrC family, sensor kinase